MKTLIPWVLVAAAVAGAGFFYSDNQKKSKELASLQATAQETEQLRTENAQLKTSQVPNEEIARLRKDSEDALRLRNEIGLLRKEKLQLSQQLQQQASKVTTLGSQVQQAQQLQSENAELKAAAQKIQAARNRNTCVNHLRQIDGAKQQWALEHRKTPESMPQWIDILPYFKDGAQPACPDGGVYTLGAAGALPACSIAGHQLPQPQ